MPPKAKQNKKATKASQIKNPGVSRPGDGSSTEMSEGPSGLDSFDNLHNDELQAMGDQLEQGEVLDESGSDRPDERQPRDVQMLIANLQNTQNKLKHKITKLSSHVDKDEASHVWKKEGLRKQNDIAERVLAKCKQALAALDNTKQREARGYVVAGVEVLVARIKELRIADSSEGGWETVNLYRTNPVADDSDDDRCIRKADKLAKERLAVKSKRGRNRRFNSFRRPFYRNDNAYNKDFPYRSMGSSRSQDNGQRGAYIPDRRRQSNGNMCYFCGQAGHWQNNCPNKQDKRDRP